MHTFITVCDVLVFEVTWQKDCYHHASICSCLETAWLMPSREDGSEVLPTKPLMSELQGWWSCSNLSSGCLMLWLWPMKLSTPCGPTEDKQSVLAWFPPPGQCTLNCSRSGYPCRCFRARGTEKLCHQTRVRNSHCSLLGFNAAFECRSLKPQWEWGTTYVFLF